MKELKTLSNDQAITEEMDAYLQAYMETKRFMGSVLVANGDEVILNRGYGMANLEHNIPNTPQTKFRLGSITKQFTATAILQLQEAKLLDVNKSISTYLPDYPNGDSITVHNLLNHTSGILSYTGFPDFLEKMRLKTTIDELIARFKDKPLEFEPGKRCEYSNSGYVVLTKIIEVVSSHSYPEYLQENIFKPLGMNDSGYDQHELILSNRASGYGFLGDNYFNAEFIDMTLTSGAGVLYSTVEDLHKWDRALYSEVILTESSKQAMFATTVESDLGTEDKIYMGYGWVIDTHYQRKRVLHNGGINGFSTSISRYLDDFFAIIVLSNVETTPAQAIGNDLAAILFGESYEIPKKRQAIELNPSIYQTYVG
ncbi:MAG: serine hydrolase domain-containing protein, partial [Cyanobacteria bacterium P01_D01_bin.50]